MEESQQTTGASLRGHVHTMRKLGNVAFMTLRTRTGITQIVVEGKSLLKTIDSLNLETVVAAHGDLVEQPKAPGGRELHLKHLEVICQPSEHPPVEINKSSKIDALDLSTLLDYRPLTLRNPKVRAIFEIEAAITKSFREFLTANEFTEIHTPKIVSTGTEGGAQLFSLDYFGRNAYLAQSPQFYKQIMVGALERVFEIGPVYRAEQHDTSRHLNEYVSCDFEMGFIESEDDVIALEEKLLKHIFAFLAEHKQEALGHYDAKVPELSTIPVVTFEEAVSILGAKSWTAKTKTDDFDLDPEAERLLCKHFEDTEGCELVFVKHYPRSVRPFYTMPLESSGKSRSFDLLFAGLEITTGGQRIHQPDLLEKNMRDRGLEPSRFKSYLDCFRYGIPPHGGLAIGLERLTKQLLGLDNIKKAALFPRDRNRLSP